MKNIVTEDTARTIVQGDKEETLVVKFRDEIIDAKGKKAGSASNRAATNSFVAAKLAKVWSSHNLPTCLKSTKFLPDLQIKAHEPIPVVFKVINHDTDKPPFHEIVLFHRQDDSLKPTTENEIIKNEWATKQDLYEMRRQVLKSNVIAKDVFARRQYRLDELNLQFGRVDNSIVLCTMLTLDDCVLYDTVHDMKIDLNTVAKKKTADEIYETFLEQFTS